MSDDESNSDDHQSTTHKEKKYKLYSSDSSIQIPLRTLCRWRTRGYSFEHTDSTIINDDNFHKNNASINTDQDSIDFMTDNIDENEADNFVFDNDSLSSESSNENLFEFNESDNESENGDADTSINSSESDENNAGDKGEGENIESLNKYENLYENSDITVDECVFNLLNFYVKYNITKVALQESLRMQLKLLPNNNQMPKTVYELFQYVQEISPPCRVIKHYYCKNCICETEIGILNKKEIFKCTSCITTDQQKFSFFHELDICDQIRILFENYNLAEKIRQPGLRNDQNISDITHGTEYERVNSRNNRGKFDLPLILNTDGLSLVKSSRSHCWPVLCTIAELPQSIRENYIIFAGLWYDNLNKPPMNVFLKPICLKLRQSFLNGIDWVNAKTGETANIKIITPLVIADASARAQLQNILNFNGRYGCNICEIRTIKSKKIDGQKTVRVYPFKVDSRIRSGKRMVAQARKLRQLGNKNQIRGVKGYTVLSYLPLIDIGSCVIPEYIHSVLLGIVKQFLSIWFNKKGPWNIKKKVQEIDNYITSILPPQSFSRLPRRLSDYKLYKASENYNFLIFYSIPTLATYLPNRHFQHWLLLVKAIFNLVEATITQHNLQESNNLLQLFVSQIQNLYSDRDLSYNSHQLLHLALCVKRWGPLNSTSAFAFESYNGFIAKCVHGNKNFGQEIVNSIQIAQGVQMLKNRMDEHKNIAGEINQSNNHEILGNNIKNVEFDINERNLFMLNGFEVENIFIYSRLKIDRNIYTSEMYKAGKTNSYTVQINCNNSTSYRSIKYFVKIQNDIFIVMRCFTVEYTKMFCHVTTRKTIEHIIPVVVSNCLMLLKLKNITSIFQLVRVGRYVCKQPNNDIKVVW